MVSHDFFRLTLPSFFSQKLRKKATIAPTFASQKTLKNRFDMDFGRSLLCCRDGRALGRPYDSALWSYNPSDCAPAMRAQVFRFLRRGAAYGIPKYTKHVYVQASTRIRTETETPAMVRHFFRQRQACGPEYICTRAEHVPPACFRRDDRPRSSVFAFYSELNLNELIRRRLDPVLT